MKLIVKALKIENSFQISNFKLKIIFQVYII